MKIILLVSNLGTGGAERVASVLSARWAAMGHEVILMTTFARRAAPQVRIDSRVMLLSIRDLLPTGPRWRHSWPFRVEALSRFIRSSRADIVCSFLTNVNVMAIIGARRAGVPVVVSERAYPPMTPTGRVLSLLRKFIYPFADTVVMQAAEGLDWLKSTIPSVSGDVIGNPVEHPPQAGEPYRDPAELCPPDRKILLAVGRLSPQKRFALLIDGFAAVAIDFAEWDLVIVGLGPLREELVKHAATYELSGRIKFAGHVGNMGDWYARADAFALTSSFEGFPNALLEALVAGLPALAIDIPTGPAEVLKDGRNGILLARGSGTAEIAAGLRRLFETAWTDTALVALELCEEFSADTIATRWTSLFQAAVEKHREA
jgi:glycosyltransferase involved in cell wall biosynthesis